MKKVLVLMLIIMIIPTVIFASEGGFVDFNTDPVAPAGLGEKTNTILGAMQYVGYAIAFGMLIYIGIKYVTSSANEKASIKQSVISYLIGILLIASVSTIFGLITGFANDVKTTGNTTPSSTITQP